LIVLAQNLYFEFCPPPSWIVEDVETSERLYFQICRSFNGSDLAACPASVSTTFIMARRFFQKSMNYSRSGYFCMTE
jgi:hypothetical protein